MATGFNPTTGSASCGGGHPIVAVIAFCWREPHADIYKAWSPTNRAGGENATTPAGSRPLDRISWNPSARQGVLSIGIGRCDGRKSSCVSIRSSLFVEVCQGPADRSGAARPVLQRREASVDDWRLHGRDTGPRRASSHTRGRCPRRRRRRAWWRWRRAWWRRRTRWRRTRWRRTLRRFWRTWRRVWWAPRRILPCGAYWRGAHRRRAYCGSFSPRQPFRRLDAYRRDARGTSEHCRSFFRRQSFAACRTRHGPSVRRRLGPRAIANVALQSQFGQARFHGAFSGSAWPWWRGGVALGWFGPLFWPYAYYDLLDYIYWPYAYDDFWPYAYDDVYYGIYGPYAYSGPYGYHPSADPNGYYTRRSARRGVSSGHYAAANVTERAAEVCSDDAAQLTNWPIERISEVVQPTGAQRPTLDG